MIEGDLAVEVKRLLSERRPFVVATVVRARHPTSVRPGDAAIVLGDGTIEGFVGGVCAEASVRLHSLRAMETGDPLLLRLIPGGGSDETDADTSAGLEGAVVEHNPCLSGGALEIFLEPHLPPARIIVVGNSPIAVAVETLARASGYDCVRVAAGADAAVAGAAAVVVASHGTSEEEVLGDALTAGVPYVALVASRTRGAAVRDALDVAPELAGQLITPAGLDLGARTPAEIAISVLAQLVAAQHADPAPGRPVSGRPVSGRAGGRAGPICRDEASAAASAVEVVTDPVCGMKVAVAPATPRLEVGGAIVHFCGEHCREAYAGQHAGAHVVR
jgi:xanthine dehydrogenase accessory factor